MLAILSGLLTHGASDPEFGIEPSYLLDAKLEPYSVSEWFDVLLDGYRDWIGEMERLNGRNARLPTATQSLFGLGVVLFGLGVVLFGLGVVLLATGVLATLFAGRTRIFLPGPVL